MVKDIKVKIVKTVDCLDAQYMAIYIGDKPIDIKEGGVYGGELNKTVIKGMFVNLNVEAVPKDELELLIEWAEVYLPGAIPRLGQKNIYNLAVIDVTKIRQ